MKAAESLKDRHTRLKEEAKVIHKEIDALNETLCRKNNEIMETALEYCFKGNLLQKTKWIYAVDYRHKLTAETWLERGKTTEIDELADLFWTSHHCDTVLSYNARIQFNDGELSLQFETFDELKKFSLEHGLKIVAKDLEHSLADAQEDARETQNRIGEIQSCLRDMKDILA